MRLRFRLTITVTGARDKWLPSRYYQTMQVPVDEEGPRTQSCAWTISRVMQVVQPHCNECHRDKWLPSGHMEQVNHNGNKLPAQMVTQWFASAYNEHVNRHCIHGIRILGFIIEVASLPRCTRSSSKHTILCRPHTYSYDLSLMKWLRLTINDNGISTYVDCFLIP